MPERINKAVELLAQDQPIFYEGAHTGMELSYEAGLKSAKTTADYINVGMEHGAFDMAGLDRFMRGLVDGGPTTSGHRTPAVLVELPVTGESGDVVRANAWQIRQILARGVHGLLLCHAETPEAVREFVENVRYPFRKEGVGAGLGVGKRGSGGQASAAEIWGVSNEDYVNLADPWPLTSDGELILGLKIENVRALSNVESTLSVPGVTFAEWGRGDMAYSLGYRQPPGTDKPLPQDIQEARDRILAACKKNGIRFLESTHPSTVVSQIDEGVRIFGYNREAAELGRKHKGRTMPV